MSIKLDWIELGDGDGDAMARSVARASAVSNAGVLPGAGIAGALARSEATAGAMSLTRKRRDVAALSSNLHIKLSFLNLTNRTGFVSFNQFFTTNHFHDWFFFNFRLIETFQLIHFVTVSSAEASGDGAKACNFFFNRISLTFVHFF